MSAARALVLIYDIRGFTAASRRVSSGDLGAFATGAHRAILDLFSAHPPTFVKHLGDGHLLLWETTDPPDAALVADVVAGAARARTAFAAYVAGREAQGEHLPRQVGVGVAYGEVTRADDYYGVALNLAARLQNLARPEGLALDRNVFDVAAARDGSLRRAFQRARVRLKGLGSTVVWVARPFSLARLLKPVAVVAGALALPAGYLLACDGDLPLPGGEAVRAFLDGREWSRLRPVRRSAEVEASVAAVRSTLGRRLLEAQVDAGWVRSDFAHDSSAPFDVWSSSQALAALLRWPELPADVAARCVAGLRAAFDSPQWIERDGVVVGWLREADVDYTEAEPCLWTAAALALALGRPGAVPEAERPAFLRLLGKAHEAALTFRPLDDGAWNIFAQQKDPARYSPYTTSLALLALLETRRAGLPFAGDVERRDRMIEATVRFLGSTFLADTHPPGWRRTVDVNDTVSPGLTLQNLALLLRAEAEAGLALHPAVERAAPHLLSRLASADMRMPPDAGEFGADFTTHEGRFVKGKESINLLWHPWAVEAGRRWLARDARRPGDRATRTRVARAVGHLAVDLSDEAVEAAGTGFVFMAAETVYALSAPPPQPPP